MKIRKLVAAIDIKAQDELIQQPSICSQEDYCSAISCIESAINILAHAVQCDKEDIVAKESIANLAVVLLDLKSAHSDECSNDVESIPVAEIVEEVAE